MIKKLALALFATSFLATGAQAQSKPFPDVERTCRVSVSLFASWLAKDIPPLVFKPANSVGFPLEKDNTKCDFYRWSAQMFLWLTSRDPAGSGRYIFDTDLFYDVSVEDADGNRKFIPSSEGNPFALRDQKIETGQAGGSAVLISQPDSLVYYGIHTNDVYAYFLSGQKLRGPKGIPADHFPASKTDLEAVEVFAGREFADGIALTMELKTSWVDAAKVDATKYLTIKATVPNYTRDSTKRWTLLPDPETKILALVGFHVVGTVQDHPEMVWATFEHQNNTPDNAYYYRSSDHFTRMVEYDGTGKWLFMGGNRDRSVANAERAKVDGATGDIVATTNQTIGPSNTYRVNPWGNTGGEMDAAKASAENNSEIISLNIDVLGHLAKLAPGDVRANYILIGALWTQKGQIPPSGTQIGSLDLANSTLETYHQKLHCFTCHKGSSFGRDQLSHIYWQLLPLP